MFPSLPRVGGNSVEIPDKKFVAGHGEVGPGWRVAEMSGRHLFERFGVGIDQQQVAALIECKDLSAVAGHAPVFSERSRCPSGLASLGVDAGEPLVPQMQVDVPVDLDRGRHVPLYCALPLLGDVELASGAIDVEKK